MRFEIIPSDPKEALEWYEKKLKEALELNRILAKNGYDPMGGITSLIFNYLSNIRSLKNRIKKT